MSTKGSLIALTILVPLLILAGCQGQSSQSTAGAGTGASSAQSGAGGGQGGRRYATISVQAVTVVSAPLITDNDTAGTVVAVTQSPVAAQVAGVVQKVYLNQGDRVAKGTPVVQLDDSALRLAVRNAQSALDNANINLTMGLQTTNGSGPRLSSQLDSAKTALVSAQKNYDSQKALFDLGGISSSTLDNAQSQLQQAQANVQAAQLAYDQNDQASTQSTAQLKLAVDQSSNGLELAKLNLQYATIRAPFDGQLAAVNVTPGMYLGLNTAAFVLVSANKQIDFSVPPADAPALKMGDTVVFSVGGKNYPVRIIQAPSAPINGVVPMVASVPTSFPLSYGAVGTIIYKLTIGNGPQIPLSALQSRANINFVDAVQNGKAAEVPVIIVAEAGTTAVVQGLNAGDQVVLNPPPGLLAGSTVQIVTASGAQAAAPVDQQGRAAPGQQNSQTGRSGTVGGKPGTGKPSGGANP